MSLIAAALRLCVAAVTIVFLCAQTRAQETTFETAPLSIVTSAGKRHDLTVELALDSNQRAQGLMYRREMASDHGMLFDFGETRRVTMWMKNTYLPLDMLFVSKSGKVETIRENAAPQSEAIIDSGMPVAYVLELNAGVVRNLGLAPGDRLQNPVIAGSLK